eukprot:3292822-Rhodomonas_salina.1
MVAADSGRSTGNNAEGRKVDAAPKAALRPTSAAQSSAARGAVSAILVSARRCVNLQLTWCPFTH